MQRANRMDRRAQKLIDYYNSLPEGVTSEALSEARNLQAKARKLREAVPCTQCGALKGDIITEFVIGVGTGWKCSCQWWNWLTREYTVCSTMVNCHRRAKTTGDPTRPPFCNRCKRITKRKRGYRRKSRAERRKIRTES